MCERQAPEEIVARVRAPGRVVSPTVVLYPPDEEWECDCGGKDDPCVHVAAATIALRRAEREGGELPEVGGADAPGHVRYAFTRAPGGLHFQREIVSGDRVVPLQGTLVALASGRIEGPPVAATATDLEVERALGGTRVGQLPRGVIASLLKLLDGRGEVVLDGAPVCPRREPAGFRARLRDRNAGFVVELVRDPHVDEDLGAGVVRCGDELRTLGASGLDGRELERFRAGAEFAPDHVTELVTEVLPSLRKRLPVDIETGRLPDSRRERPRILLRTERGDGGLLVLPILVYGDPPLARVDAGRLIPQGEGPVPIRDAEAERYCISALRRELGLTPGVRVELGPEEALDFVGRLPGFSGLVEGSAHEAFFKAETLVPRIRVEGERLEVSFAPGGRDDQGRVDAEAVLRAWTRGERTVALSDGGFAPLPAEFLARHGRSLADLLAGRDAQGRIPTVLLPDLGLLAAELDEPPPPALEGLRPLLDQDGALPPAALPEDLDATLRPYQKAGIDWLSFLRGARLGALLADDMGLGKTIQALCVLDTPALVVCPTSVLPNWVSESERFRPGLRLCLYHGPNRRLDPEADLTLTSYALLRIDQEAIAAHGFRTVVLDEAQQIKNPDSQIARAAYRLDADFRIALSGTPVENRLEELWSQLHFVNPGLLGTRADFDEHYAQPISEGDTQTAARLRARIRPFVLRRRKAEVAPELPPRQELLLRCALSEEERGVYDAVRAATVPEVVDQLRQGGNVMKALEALLRLRQACCHAGLVPGQPEHPSTKLSLLRERLESAVADGHKALVFSQWTSLLDRVEPVLEDAGLGFVRLDGSTRDRGAVLRTFDEDDGPPVLLLSLRAGGTGLNLTQADHVFLLDPWWNPAVEDQAADRAHRIGQTRPVLVQRIVARDSVEERILALQLRKRALADAALEGGSATALTLTRDDLLDLLGEEVPGLGAATRAEPAAARPRGS